MSDRVTVCKPTEELDRLRMWTDDAAAELTRLRADLAAAQEREQRMREALANIMGNMEPDPDDPDRRRMLSNGFARWEALEADARATLSAMRGEP